VVVGAPLAAPSSVGDHSFVSDAPRRRKQLRLRQYDYSSYGAYFITIVTSDRRHLFGEIVDDAMRQSVAGSLVLDTWNVLSGRFANVGLDASVVMPNHVHGILWLLDDDPRLPATGAASSPAAAGETAPTIALETQTNRVGRPMLGDVIRVFKSTSAVAVNRELGRSGDVWQRNYFEKITRSQAQLDALRRYIEENPLRWALDEENAANGPGPHT